MKIVYCIDSIGAGGVEQITVVKANALAEVEGNHVWILYTDLPFPGGFHQPSDKVIQIDLGIRYRENHLRFPFNIAAYIIKGKRHRKALASVLKSIGPDVVISTSQKERIVIPGIKGDWVKLRELHMLKGWRRNGARSFRDRVLASIVDYYDYSINLRKYDRVVVLTQSEKEKIWKNDKRFVVIPNPARIRGSRPVLPKHKSVVAVGRLSHDKNYSSLIRAFRVVSNRFQEWKLAIVGEGREEESLKNLISSLGLNSIVSVPGFIPDLTGVFDKASIFVHTAISEAFGLVIIEAMSHRMPVVAYDCPYGPGGIIDDGVNGFLVPVGNEDALVGRICELIEDKILRERMADAAYEKSKLYSIDRVVLLWMDLFKHLKGNTSA